MTYHYGLGDDIDTGRQDDTSRFAASAGICVPTNDFATSYSINTQKVLNVALKAQGRALVRTDGNWDPYAAQMLAYIFPEGKITATDCYNLIGRIVRIWQGASAKAGILAAEAAAKAPIAASDPGTAVSYATETTYGTRQPTAVIQTASGPAVVPVSTAAALAPKKGGMVVILAAAVLGFLFLRKGS